MQKSVVEDSCWEQRLRLVVHILLRSLSVATALEQQHKQTSNTNATNQPSTHHKHYQHQQVNINTTSPVVIECLTLPCLRILNHLCKSSTNVAHLTHLITTAKAQSSQQKQQQQQQMNASLSASTSVNGSRQVAPTVVAPHPPPTSSSLGRYLSEPVENNYLQVINWSA